MWEGGGKTASCGGCGHLIVFNSVKPASSGLVLKTLPDSQVVTSSFTINLWMLVFSQIESRSLLYTLRSLLSFFILAYFSSNLVCFSFKLAITFSNLFALDEDEEEEGAKVFEFATSGGGGTGP